MNIDNMEAGPEMDALIAEKIMGWTNVHMQEQIYFEPIGSLFLAGTPPNRTNIELRPVPLYSSFIGAAWEVVKKMRGHCHSSLISRGRTDGKSAQAAGWQAEFSPYGPDMTVYVGIASDPALAICRAALKVVTGEV